MGKKLFVGGLPWSMGDEDLKDTFSPFGNVREAKVITDRDTGRSRGFGFVTFEAEADAKKAIQAMDGSVVGTRTINVNEAQERPRTGGGGGGDFRSGGGGPPRDYRGGGGGYDDRRRRGGRDDRD